MPPTTHESGGGRGDAEHLGSIEPGAGDYVERNRAAWDRWAKQYTVTARKAWTSRELTWGIWSVPEAELGLLHAISPGSDVIELGCGPAATCAWLSRLGLRPVGVDISRAQLDHGARLQRELGPLFPLIHANAEQVPFDTESFDLAISEYGASLWCDPRKWLAEANRLLRTGGHLIIVVNGALLMTCTPTDGGRAGDRLVRDYFGSAVIEFPGDDIVEFHLTHGQWVRLLRESGFVLDDLVEVRAPQGAKAKFEFVSVEWARRWPSEEIWIARKIT
jgi:SAM-dependent methyltransferase